MVSEKDLQSYLKVAASALPCREARKEFSSYVHTHPSITMVLLPVLLQQAEREQVLTGGAMEIKRHGLAETVPI